MTFPAADLRLENVALAFAAVSAYFHLPFYEGKRTVNTGTEFHALASIGL
jgi:hypothetical protein